MRRCVTLGCVASQRRRYVESLRSVLCDAPVEGLSVGDVAARLSVVLGSRCDPTAFGFAKLSHALQEVQDLFYIQDKNTVVPCAWSSVMRSVRRCVPQEGVVLCHFLQFVRVKVPQFGPESVPGTLEQWLRVTSKHYFDVHRSRSDPHELIVRPVMTPTGSKALYLSSSLVLAGRGDHVPALTRLDRLVSLMPPSVTASPEALLKNGVLDARFAKVVDVALASGSSNSNSEKGKQRVLIVDGTSVRAKDAQNLVRLEGSDPDATPNHRTHVQVFRRQHDERHSDADIVVPSYLDVADEMVGFIARQRCSLVHEVEWVLCVGPEPTHSVERAVADAFTTKSENHRILVQTLPSS